MRTFARKQKGCFTRNQSVLVIAFVVGLGACLTGHIPAQEIVLDPMSIDFGKVLIGASAQQTLTISNEGTEDLIVSDASVDNQAFGVEPTSFTVLPDSSSSLAVTFTPADEGSESGTLTISSNDPDDPTVDIPLSGAGADVEAALSVADGYGDPGTINNKVSIILDNTIDVAGLNFTINFDPAILEPTNVMPTDRTDDMSEFKANLQLGPGQAILVIADIELTPILAGSGAIATFSFDVAPEAALGEYPITLTEVTLSDSIGLAIFTDVGDGAFHVTGPSGEAWAVSLTATSSNPEASPAELAFGAGPDGTDGFDPALDEPAAPRPPGTKFWAYFSIESVVFPELLRDVRSSMVLTLSWTLVTGGTGGTLTWDPESLPGDAIFEINGMDMSENGSLDFSENESFTITYTFQDQTPPSDVSDLVGIPGDETVMLSWTASTSHDVQGYNVYVDSAGMQLDVIDVGDVTFYEVGGLFNLATYTFTVTAYDEMGNESNGVSVDVTPSEGSYGIMLTLGSSAHDDTVRVFFGGDPEGSDGFDAGLDLSCPPPPPPPLPELTAYFPIDHHIFDKLCTDIRSSLEDTVIWTLVTEGTGGEICWDPDALPTGVYLMVLGPGNEVNMHEEECAEFSANDTLIIYHYIYPVSIEPEPEVLIPDEYMLIQNYPNPFNPETTIEYRIPASGQVKLEIFNVLGQPVRTLVHERQDAGSYSVVWDGMDGDGLPVASGIYFYRFQAGEFAATKSMLLLK